MIEPPSPDADPARSGRTESIPALAFGSATPLPNPMLIVSPKKTTGPDRCSRVSSVSTPKPTKVIRLPINTIWLIPTRTEKRPAKKFPLAYPTAVIANSRPIWVELNPKIWLPTKGAPPR